MVTLKDFVPRLKSENYTTHGQLLGVKSIINFKTVSLRIFQGTKSLQLQSSNHEMFNVISQEIGPHVSLRLLLSSNLLMNYKHVSLIIPAMHHRLLY